MGDFKYDPLTKQSDDYLYDANGNMIRDNNKGITSVTYNHLNLPQTIEVKYKGIISYVRCFRNKLKRTVVDQTVSPHKTSVTAYPGGSVYVNDSLQFMLHEEGRIRPVKDTAGNMTELTCDYFLRDHLGNVRMVLTDEQETDMYLPATMELTESSTEEKLYTNVNSTRANKPAGYPTDDYTDPNDKVAVVNEVSYQPELSDQFFHRYGYDAENRLTTVETSADNIYWETNGSYEYYRHDPPSRIHLQRRRYFHKLWL